MQRRTIVVGGLSSFALAACAQTWRVGYEENPPATRSANWNLASVLIVVPSTLTVSEANTLSPDADIVWRGEPLGDRRAQVSQIMREAAQSGAIGLRGNGPDVTLELTILRFHGVTERTRERFEGVGVHNIVFGLRVINTATGAVLASEDQIRAPLPAYTGTAAREAEALGQTQRVRVVRHVSQVIASWLGTGPDVRTSFTRTGR